MFQAQPAQFSASELYAAVQSHMAQRDIDLPGGAVPMSIHMRNIRLYTYIGLMDRPVDYEAGAPLFNSRHLAQLLAIRALQARGVTLSSMHRILYGLNPVELERLVQLACEGPVGQAPGPSSNELPQPRIAMEAEDRGTCIDWLNLYTAPRLLTQVGIYPAVSHN